MKLLQLRYFKAICEMRSMTRAAASLRVAQPALGFQIAQLEGELGTRLLARHSRGVEPTLAGNRLYGHAVRILADVENVKADIHRLGAAAQLEPVTLGMAPSVLAILGAEVLRLARASMPDIALSLIEQPSFALTQATCSGEIDAALVNDAPERAGISRRPLIEEDLLFVTGPGRGQTAPTIEFSEALEWELVLGGRRDPIRRQIEDLAARLNVILHVPFEVQSVPVLKELLMHHRVGAILPYGTVHAEVAEGRLHAAAICNPAPRRTIHLIRFGNRPVFRCEPQFEAFVGLILANLKRMLEMRSWSECGS